MTFRLVNKSEKAITITIPGGEEVVIEGGRVDREDACKAAWECARAAGK